MKVNLSRSAGFCLGVRRAIETALKAAQENDEIYMLGDIVHNEFVVRMIQEHGIKKINSLGEGLGNVLMIRAHGAPLSVYSEAEGAGYKIIDATCPMVKEIQKIAKTDELDGRSIIIIGDKKHEEVRGIKGSLSKDALVIDPTGPLPEKELHKIDRASVVVQSTQNTDTVNLLVKKLRTLVPDLIFHDTICAPTKSRQKDARAMPLANDTMVIIGSRTSANTKRLYEISKSLNDRTCWISSAEEIEADFFKGSETVGVLAGASTPDEIINEVVLALKELTPGKN